MNQPRSGNALALLLGFVLLVFAGWGLLQHQFMSDWLRANQFQASAEIEQLAASTTMTDRARLLFFASEPRLEGAEQFNQACSDVEKSSAVLGCYVNRKIYIYGINNPELPGIEDVTAAHEMLHAAYDRLSTGERRDVNNLLNQEALSLRADEKFTKRLEAYDFADSDEKHNELHSIIGTEIADISPDLEEYYTKYFNDRSAIISMHSGYQAVFSGYIERARQLADELDSLAASINSLSANYQTNANRLERDIESFNSRADRNGGFVSEQAFNSERSNLANRQQALSAEFNRITSQRNRYDRLLEEYNGIARHITDLNNSIDSRIEPVSGTN